MLYDWTTEIYGPLPQQTMLVGRPKNASAPVDRYAYVAVPGGGWGLRDPLPFLQDEAAVGGGDYSARWTLFGGAFDNPNSTKKETATVFVLNVASEYQNGAGIGLTSAADYSDDVTSDLLNSPHVVWDGEVGQAWERNDIYPVGGGGIGAFICLKSHTASSSNSPFGAGLGEFWARYPLSSCFPGRRPGAGDGTPGSAYQSARDVQRAIAHIRRNADSYLIDPKKVILEGQSAGAQAAGMAAYTDPLPFGHTNHGSAARASVPNADCRPNGVILGIAACKQDEYVTVNKGAAVQGQFLSFMGSLHGDPSVGQFAAWRDLPIERKRSLDPYWAVSSSGFFAPTYMQYTTDGGLYDCWTREDMLQGVATSDYSAWNGSTAYQPGAKVLGGNSRYYVCIEAVTGGAQPSGLGDTQYWAHARLHSATGTGTFPPQIHHSQNGRVFMNLLTGNRASGGMGLAGGTTGDVRLSVKEFGRKVFNEVEYTFGNVNMVSIYNDEVDLDTYGPDVTQGRETRIDATNNGSYSSNDDMKIPEATYMLDNFFTQQRMNKYF